MRKRTSYVWAVQSFAATIPAGITETKSVTDNQLGAFFLYTLTGMMQFHLFVYASTGAVRGASGCAQGG